MMSATLLAAVVVCTNVGFRTAFDTARNLPVWAEYELAASNVVKAPRATYSFRTDPRCGRDMAAYYRGSGYDRGHLVPDADMHWSTNALRATYLFSNVCPMTPRLNRGAWEQTEAEVRRLAASNTVHVLIVPVYWYQPDGDRIVPPSEFVKIAWGDFGVRYWRLQQD